MMADMPLPQYPARVKVTTKDGAVLWLGDPPEAPWGAEHRWRLVEVADAGIWPWPRAVELERAVRQPWRQQYATAERVEEDAAASVRSETGDRARARAEACGVPDWQHVMWAVFGPSGATFGYADDREPAVLPLIAAVG
jgi:hypothetical protein